MAKISKIFECQSCNYKTSCKDEYKNHYLTAKKHVENKNLQKKSPYYYCINCNYRTVKKADFVKHIFTPKHLAIQNAKYIGSKKIAANIESIVGGNNTEVNSHIHSIEKNANNMLLASTYMCVLCNRTYKHQSSLSRHMKLCACLNKNDNNMSHHKKNTHEQLTNDNKMITNDNKMITNDNKMLHETSLVTIPTSISNETHNKTGMHCNNTDESSNSTIQKKYSCKYCNNAYRYASGLSRHAHKCQKKHTGGMTLDITSHATHNVDTGVQDLLMKCFEMMTEQTQTMNKLIPNIGNNNNNTTTNKFNLNVYLNDTCKDAINLPEFVNNIALQLTDLLSARKDGLLSSTTNVFLKELQGTESVRRPIQCTDIKRKTMYIKEAGEWSKDIGNEKLKKAMSSISQKHMHLINDWKQKNPHHMESEQGQEEFVKVIQSATKDIKDDTRRLQSAVKEIGEIVHVVQSDEL